uniref:C2H2-type domain-containing protein n=1 Tax=Cyclopterus lumpus TaxID=8103 RepID=A0A8C2WBI5_CYCLU
MGEVTVEVDAEVAKQDVSLEPLPEPLLIILSPPPPFLPVPGEPTMFWHKWLKAFEHYVEALGEDELVDSSKRVLFQNCLGLEGQRVFATLIPGETTYAAAVSALTVYFCSDRGSQVRRLQFHQRAQMPGETADLLESFAGLQSHKRTHASGVLRCREKFTDNDAFCGHVASHDDHPTQTEGRSPRQSEQEKNQKEIIESHSDDGDSQDEESKVNVKTEEKDTDRGKPQDGDSRKEKVACKTKTKGHFCPICVGRRFRGPNKLARHMRTHTKEKPFSCPVCAMTFSQSYHMTRHLRKQHGLGQYICDKCGKSLGSWLELKAHKKTHAVEGLTCLSCDKQFKEKAALVSHLKLHKKVQSSPRSLVCSDCGKRFGRMYHLKRHIVTHRFSPRSSAPSPLCLTSSFS